MTLERRSARGRALALANRGFGRLHCWTYRVSGGRFGGRTSGAPVLLLTTTGRRSGKSRTAPVIYWERDGDFVVSASNAGNWVPGWYHNLRADPRAVIRVGRRVLECDAHLAGADESLRLWVRTESLNSRFATYAARREGPIDMVVLHPRQG